VASAQRIKTIMKLLKESKIRVGADCLFSLNENPHFNKRFKAHIHDRSIKKIVNILIKLEADEKVAKLIGYVGSGHDEGYWMGWQNILKFKPLLDIRGKKAQRLWLALNG
jgi:hypothetical protein